MPGDAGGDIGGCRAVAHPEGRGRLRVNGGKMMTDLNDLGVLNVLADRIKMLADNFYYALPELEDSYDDYKKALKETADLVGELEPKVREASELASHMLNMIDSDTGEK
jgi:hypothetical protein